LVVAYFFGPPVCHGLHLIVIEFVLAFFLAFV